MLKKIQLFLGLIIFGMTATATANWHFITNDQGFKIDVVMERPTTRLGIEIYPLTVRLWSKWHNENGEAFEEPQSAYTPFKITCELQQAKQSYNGGDGGIISLMLAEDAGDEKNGWIVQLAHPTKDVWDSAGFQPESQHVSALSFVHARGDLALHIDLQARRIASHRGQTHQLALSFPLSGKWANGPFIQLNAGSETYDDERLQSNPAQPNNYGAHTTSKIRESTFKPFERYRNQ